MRGDMNIRATLCLLAASLAPAFAQEPGEPPATQQPCPATPSAAAMAERRAAVFSSLAPLPAELSSFFVLCDFGGNLTRLTESGAFPELQVTESDKALDGIAIASSRANAGSCKAAAQITANIFSWLLVDRAARSWMQRANDTTADIIRDEALSLLDDWENEAIALLPEVRIHPVYMVTSYKQGKEELRSREYQSQLMALHALCAAESNIERVEHVPGFAGIRCSWPATDESSDKFNRAVDSELAGRFVYILLREEGNAIVTVVCEEPSEIQLAATPAESVLATELLAEADAQLDRGMIALGRTEGEFLSMSGMVTTEILRKLGTTAAHVFAALGRSDERNSEAYSRAATACEGIVTRLSPLLRPDEKPSTLKIWHDEDLHLQLSIDAQGAAFTPAPLRHMDRMHDGNTILYAAMSPISGGATLPSPRELMEATLAIAPAFAHSLSPRHRARLEKDMRDLGPYLPALGGIADALHAISIGLDGNAALIVDAVPSTVPGIFVPEGESSSRRLTALLPRLALSIGVDDRSKLSEGWDGLLASCAAIGAQWGYDPNALGMLPIVPTEQGEGTTYTLSLPIFTPECVPTLSVSGNSLIAGSSRSLNNSLMSSATGGAVFEGAFFIVRFRPLAASLNSLADAYNERTAEQDRLLTDDPYAYFMNRSARQQVADELRELADAAAGTGNIAESLHGSVTTEKGCFIIRCTLNLE